jgi:transcriptional regulator with XRE-family HTH domain
MGGADTFGKLLRQWREHRRLSQLTLAGNAEISTKHLSFLETGRAAPSREMIVRLAEELQIPLRQRNVLLTAGGYAEIYPERTLSDPGLQLVDEVIRTVLRGHEPNPAMAIDYGWNIVAMNRAMQMLFGQMLMGDAALTLLEPPVNAMRVALHPEGLAPRILNFSAWRVHVTALIKHRADLSADANLIALLDEVQGYGYSSVRMKPMVEAQEDFAIPLQLETPKGNISLVTATLAFGLPRDVTVSELSIECLFPADKESGDILHALVRGH